MTTNDTPWWSIIQYVQDMISKNKFDITICEPYLTKIQSDMTVVLKAYESTIYGHEKMNNELIGLRLCFLDEKLQ